MTKKQLNVRIDSELDSRLETLAKRTGRTKSFYAVQAIQKFLENHEDYFWQKTHLRNFKAPARQL